MAASETHSDTGACPTDEEIAAFLDNMLPAKERARIAGHLAACESCYEVFAGAVHFLHDEKGSIVVPFPRGEGARRRWWIPATAAAVLALGLGFVSYRAFFAERNPASGMEVATLIEPFQAKPALVQSLYPFHRNRGAGGNKILFSEQTSFMVGALLVDLRISLKEENDKGSEEAKDLLSQIGQELNRTNFMGDEATLYAAEAEKVRTEGIKALAPLAAIAQQREADLDNSYLDPQSLAFGKWAEAARLAAVTQTPAFFTNRANRRFLSIVLRDLEKDKQARAQEAKPAESATAVDDELSADADRADASLEDLKQVRTLWDRGHLQAEDYAALAARFSQIIQRYDQ